MFERLLQGMARLAHIAHAFLGQDFFLLKLGNPLLIGAYDGGRAGIDDAIQQLLDLLFNARDFALQGLCRARKLGQTHVPGAFEHGLRKLEHIGRRLQPLEQFLELSLQPVAGDGLAIADAPLRRAEVIGIFLGLALRPAGRQRLSAVLAQNEAAQREILPDVLTGRGFGIALQTFLYALKRLKGDQPLMVSFAQGHVPVGSLDVSGIDDARQDVGHPLVADFSVGQVFREGGLAFQKALHLHLRRESARGVAFQRLLEDGGLRLVPNEDLAVTARPLIAIADRGLENPIAVQGAGPHPVDGLLAVLLPLVLGDGGQQVLDQQGIGILAELDGGALEDAARAADLGAELQVSVEPTGKARDVIDDDHMRVFAMLPQEGEHGLHAGPGGKAARHIVCEHPDDFEALELRIFAAAGLLRAEAVTLLCLLAR